MIISVKFAGFKQKKGGGGMCLLFQYPLVVFVSINGEALI